MNKTDEKIILYLDNQMSGKEKKEFEQELEESAELRDKLKSMRTGLMNLKLYSSTSEVNESYFMGIIPEFRKRAEEGAGKSLFNPRYIPAFSAVAAVLLLIIVLVLTNNNQEEYLDFTSLNENEIEAAGTEYDLFDDISSVPEKEIEAINQRIDSVLAEELFLAEDGIYYSLSDLNQVIASLSYEETEDIYNRIINTKIINGDL
jgi:hypothetical protein